MSIQLMLAREDGRPYLAEEGCDPDEATKAAAPATEEAFSNFREDFEQPNDLSKQRWGLIVPEGPEGKRLTELMAPLIAGRRRSHQEDDRGV